MIWNFTRGKHIQCACTGCSNSICHYKKKTTATVDFKASKRNKQRMLHVIPPLLAAQRILVQRGRRVKSMSLVPSQDKVLLALSPSALINSRLTAHRESGNICQHITPYTHTRTQASMMIVWTITPTTVTSVVRLIGQMTVGSRSNHAAKDTVL